jgi:tRNA pseudouridine55 synthase
MNNPAPHGVIIVDKPPNTTSHFVVTRVKKALGVRKAGHTGTLDPFATGVLPVCINEGTKLSPFLMEQDKDYEGVFLLGVETDTQDCTGRTIRERAVSSVNDKDIAKVFEAFQGSISQIPPMFSAIKHNGSPLYELARQGVEVNRTARKVTIYSLELSNVELPRVSFRVRCSKGTYVRTLVSDIGAQLQCGACLQALRRTRAGQFDLENSIDFNILKKKSRNEIFEKWLISPAEALVSFPAVSVDDTVAQKVRQGMTISVGELGKHSRVLLEPAVRIRVLNNEGQLVAVAKTIAAKISEKNSLEKRPAWKLLRVFNQ